MRGGDVIRLRHMLDAAREAVSFARNRTRSDLDTDRMLLLSLTKEIEIIGEAASRVAPEYRQRYAQIPWHDIIATRNRLIHGYFDIDLDVVWGTVANDLPRLIAELEQHGPPKAPAP